MIDERHPPKHYELWRTPDGCETSFFAEDNHASRAILPVDAKHVWSCLAESYIDAQAQLHAHMGWAPYAPPSLEA